MRWFPSAKIDMLVPLSPEEARQVLQSRVRPIKLRIGFWLGGYYQGRVDHGSFKIGWLHRFGFSNSFAPVITGRLEAADQGTLVRMRLALHPFVLAFSLLWIGGAALIGIPFAIAAINQDLPWFMGFIGLGSVLSMWGFASLCFWPEVRQTRRRMERLFGSP